MVSKWIKPPVPPVGLGLFLEEKLGCPVDIVPRRALRREIQDEALNQAVPV
jgi:predicted nucleotidyltransferase